MSTDHVSRAARTAALLYPVVTILALALTFVLFITGDDSSITRTVVFLAWLALLVYSLIRVLSDVLSGQHKKARNFQNTLDNFVQNTAYFTATVAVSSVLKLAVPVVLWAIFR